MKYGRIKLAGGEEALVLSSRLESVRNIDAIAFDCDGVLVDTSRSYDATILKVTDTMLRRMLGLRLPWKRVGPSLIRMLRRTGGFNNDWNTTYALIVFSAVSLPLGMTEKIIVSDDADAKKMVPTAQLDEVLSRVVRLTKAFCSSRPRVGHKAIDEFVGKRRSEVEARMAAHVRDWLGYPGNPPNSAMATLFDEFYHGADLFAQMYGFDARHYRGRGMIEREIVIIRRRELEKLTKMLGRNLAVVTGRPFLAAKHTLGTLLDRFDLGASVYIGDADVYPQLAPEYEKYQKPSRYSLVRAMELFSSETLLYVGDSEEDRMMVENARESGWAVLFAGIYGTAADETEQANYFKSRGADMILRSVNGISDVLEGLRN